MAQTPLTLHDREEIGIALTLNPDVSWAVMGRSMSTLIGQVCRCNY
jgi:hypothetical protein